MKIHENLPNMFQMFHIYPYVPCSLERTLLINESTLFCLDPNRPDKTRATPLHFAARKRESVLTEVNMQTLSCKSSFLNLNK